MNSLTLTWFGHAAFLLEAGGVRILLDPYKTPDVGGYAPIETDADIVLVSHLNPKYHSHWDAAAGMPLRLNGLDFADSPQSVAALGIDFKAIKVWESPAHDVPVSMPYFDMAGLSFCHSGDLGDILTEAEVVPIRGVDIFLAVAGGPPTLPIADLKTVIDLIQPRIVIPMHYQNGKVNLSLRPVDDLLAQFAPSQIVYHPSPTLELSSEMLPSETKVFVLPSAR